MAEFQPITTQEELNAVMQDRINRQNEKHKEEMASLTAQYSDYDSIKAQYTESADKIKALTEQLEQATASSQSFEEKIKTLESTNSKLATDALKTKVAVEYGLGYNSLEFITGETEEEIKSSAEKLKGLIGARNVAPMATPEPSEGDGVMAAFKALNPRIKI